MTNILSALTIVFMGLQTNLYAHPGHGGNQFHDFPNAFVVAVVGLIIFGLARLLIKKN